MKKYDFETLIDRHGHDAIAVDGIGKSFAPGPPKDGFDFIPMWIADMNFPTADSIISALVERAQHPAFGYFNPMDEYFDAILYWHKLRKHTDGLKKEDIGYENGVLGGVISAMKIFAQPGDSVLLHSPVYIGFKHALEPNGYHLVYSPLKRDEQGIWRMDYEDMDRKLKENHIHVAVFCNPHNPCGRVWTKEEIAQAMEVYERNDCFVISDEIWSDLMMNGSVYTPTQLASEWAHEHTAAFYAPSKTFNLAGLVGSYSVIYNKTLRERIQGVSARLIYNTMNVFSEHALIGAYSEEGDNWLSQLLPVLSANVDLAADTIRDRFEGVTAFRTEGTYMMLLDCTEWLAGHGRTQPELLKRGWDYGIGWQDGAAFEAPTSIRINLASPTYRIREAFRRMDEYVFNAEW